MKNLLLLPMLCFVFTLGCATKNYYYHPEKTPAAIEMDYTTMLSEYTASVAFQDLPSDVVEQAKKLTLQIACSREKS